MALEGEVGANDGFSGPRKRELYVRGRSLRCKTEHQKADVQSPHGRFSPAPKTRHTISIPKTPTGAERPADVIGNAVHVMRIATGEVEDVKTLPDPAKEHMRRGGLKGGKKRAKKLNARRRKEIAAKAARARWSRKRHLTKGQT